MDDSTRPPTTLYISNLAPAVTSQTLSETFIPFGEITSVTLPRPQAPSSTDPHRGFGYVEFEDAGDAAEAVRNVDQAELFGRVVKVSVAKGERRGEGEKAGAGSLVAVWEMEGYGEGKVEVGDVEREEKGDEKEEDPMQGLEGLDVAGPRFK